MPASASLMNRIPLDEDGKKRRNRRVLPPLELDEACRALLLVLSKPHQTSLLAS